MKKLKVILDVTTNVVVVVFAVVAIGVLVKNYFAPQDAESSAAVEKEDGRLHIRKITIRGLGQGDGLRNYPPIFHLNYTGKGNLLVWTSLRDASGRQVVDVYDERLKHVGTDLKFMNPGRSDYVFRNQKVYAPDYGCGGTARAYTGSPLEIPAAPLALKVFDALL